MEAIRAHGLYPTQIVEAGKGKIQQTPAAKKKAKGAKKQKGKLGGKIKAKALMIFTRQLATLIDAGLPLLQSLNVLAKQEANPNLRVTIEALGDSVQGSLSAGNGQPVCSRALYFFDRRCVGDYPCDSVCRTDRGSRRLCRGAAGGKYDRGTL